MALTAVRRSIDHIPNMCSLILMLTLVLLYIHGAVAATGYVPSPFQEENGDVQKVRPIQHSGTLIYSSDTIYYEHEYILYNAIKAINIFCH